MKIDPSLFCAEMARLFLLGGHRVEILAPNGNPREIVWDVAENNEWSCFQYVESNTRVPMTLFSMGQSFRLVDHFIDPDKERAALKIRRDCGLMNLEDYLDQIAKLTGGPSAAQVFEQAAIDDAPDHTPPPGSLFEMTIHTDNNSSYFRRFLGKCSCEVKEKERTSEGITYTVTFKTTLTTEDPPADYGKE